MKRFVIILTILILFSCSEKADNQPSSDFRDITELISTDVFEDIKSFIINKGDRETYCNMYNNNPHYAFDGFEVYLNPEIGQANINCDVNLSDFNELVIRDQSSDPQYFHILIVRPGDLGNNRKNRTDLKMKENKVYLLKYYEYDLDLMKDQVELYLDDIKDFIE